MMPVQPTITSEMEKKYPGYSVISLMDGTIAGIGKNSLLAVEEAKKTIPNIIDLDFLISRIDNGLIHIY